MIKQQDSIDVIDEELKMLFFLCVNVTGMSENGNEL